MDDMLYIQREKMQYKFTYRAGPTNNSISEQNPTPHKFGNNSNIENNWRELIKHVPACFSVAKEERRA